MDYYRHCFNYDDVRENLLNAVADFGFVEKSTREPYYGSLAIPGGKTKTLCWGKDLLADTTIYVYLGNATANQACGLMFHRSHSTEDQNIPGWNLNTSWSTDLDNMAAMPTLGQTLSVKDASYNYFNQSIIMIPLINGGFLYNITLFADYGYAAYHKLNPTPKLNIIGDANSNPTYSVNKTVIGIPNTLKTNLNNYLYFGLSGKRVSSDITDKYFLTDYQQSRALNYIPFINTDSTDYTDLNNNICTLIKMPYDNGYLDNVYMMATRPGDLTKEGSFFSFAGRNFINVYKNLVLELPS